MVQRIDGDSPKQLSFPSKVTPNVPFNEAKHVKELMSMIFYPQGHMWVTILSNLYKGMISKSIFFLKIMKIITKYKNKGQTYMRKNTSLYELI